MLGEINQLQKNKNYNCGFIYKVLGVRFMETDCGRLAIGAGGNQEWGIGILLATEFQFGEMKKFRRWRMKCLCHKVNILTATGLNAYNG